MSRYLSNLLNPPEDLLNSEPIKTMKGGDFLKGDGTGSFSIYGEKFPVSFINLSIMRILHRLLVSIRTKILPINMSVPDFYPWYPNSLFPSPFIDILLKSKANSGPDTNGCQVNPKRLATNAIFVISTNQFLSSSSSLLQQNAIF